MPSFESILGTGEVSHSGSSVSNDAAGRNGELVMGTHETNGKRAFRLVLHDLNFQPANAFVTRFVVKGYSSAHCSGEVKCTNNALPANPIRFSNPQSNNFGHYFLDARDHDNGILTGLLQQCGCGTAGVLSVKAIVQVEVLPAPTPSRDMHFEFCFECNVEALMQDQQKRQKIV